MCRPRVDAFGVEEEHLLPAKGASVLGPTSHVEVDAKHRVRDDPMQRPRALEDVLAEEVARLTTPEHTGPQEVVKH